MPPRASIGEVPSHAPARAAEEYWWTDWRSTAAVVGLVFAIAAGLYLVGGKTLESGAGAFRAAISPAGPASATTSGSRGADASGAGAAPKVTDAQSFLAFSRAMKAAHTLPRATGAPAAPAGQASAADRPAPPSDGPPAAPSVLSHGEQKVVLPQKLSGDCTVGGASLSEFLKGLGACFARGDGRDA